MLMGKAWFKCVEDYTQVDIPARCIETFCIGKNFPLTKSSGKLLIKMRESGIELTEAEEFQEVDDTLTGTYKRDEEVISIQLPAQLCETTFKSEQREGEVRIEAERDIVIISKL